MIDDGEKSACSIVLDYSPYVRIIPPFLLPLAEVRFMCLGWGRDSRLVKSSK